MSRNPTPTPLERVIDKLGGQAATGRFIGVSQQLVSKWVKLGKPLPAEHVLKVEAATGISRHIIRGDIYPVPAE